MPDTPKFVVNDRRKFTSDGEPRQDENTSPASREASVPRDSGPQLISATSTTSVTSEAELTDLPESASMPAAGTSPVEDPYTLQAEGSGELAGSEELEAAEYGDEALPTGPTEEQADEAARAYNATVDRLDTALRVADPGGERMPEMSFERLTQSLYTQALMLLGGGTQPGEQPRVDILGARQTIDMIAIIADKTRGNLTSDEDKLLGSALFDLRMGFLEITQALARQAAQRQGAGPGSFGGPGGPTGGPGGLGNPGGPRIVR